MVIVKTEPLRHRAMGAVGSGAGIQRQDFVEKLVFGNKISLRRFVSATVNLGSMDVKFYTVVR